jgi:AraC family transcriptional regulator
MENQENSNAVRRMQDYIRQHITQAITLHMLAQVAGYSPWHTTRIFKEVTGKSPFEYIRTRRLSMAATKLRKSDAKIIDVALDFVFQSHEGFTRAFTRQFGVPPQHYSKNAPPTYLFIPESIRDYYRRLKTGVGTMTSESNTNTVFVQVIERPPRKLILKRGVKAENYYEYCEEVGCEIWDELSAIKEALYEPIGMWLPGNLRKSGTSMYAQGVEMPLNYTGDIPAGYEMIKLPACKMMVFQGQPYDDEKFEQAIGDIWDVMKKYDPKLYGFTWADEDGPRFQLSPMGYRGYIEARPVRQIDSK